MSVRIANPAVIAKIERLALATGQGKSAAVEAALDRMLADLGEVDAPRVWSTFDAFVAQLHRLPPRADAFEAVAFDEFGVPMRDQSTLPRWPRSSSGSRTMNSTCGGSSKVARCSSARSPSSKQRWSSMDAGARRA
jgi:antitoxin VapB